MSYGNLTNFWSSFGINMGEPSGRSGESSEHLVDDSRAESLEGSSQREAETTNNAVEQELQTLVNRFVERLEKENWKDSGYYISDVYACESSDRAIAVARRLEERARSFGRGFIGIFLHGDHVHSIHSCPFTSRCCKCFFKKFPEAQEDLRRLLRKPRAIETFNRRDWENITKYFCTKGRRATFFKIYGAIQRIPLEITSLSDSLVSSQNEGRPETSVEDCNDPLQCNNGSYGGDISKGPRSNRKRAKRDIINPGGSRGISGGTGIILELLSKCAVCPLTEIVYTREYLTNSEVACKRLDSKEVKDAVDTRGSIINTWDREDFQKFYSDPSTIKIWSARHLEFFDTYYLSYDESMTIIYKLLEFQMGDNLTKFICTLIDVLEYRLPKTNCFVVISPPSAGKNFFFDGIRDYYLNTGQMNNPNKYNQFAYQDCHNRRVIFWNEPNYEPREIENLKMLFGGDNMSANIKCKPQANVKRTPIIVTSNYRPHFANHYAFADRITVWNWVAAPFLKEIKKKPRPDAVMDLLYSITLNKQ